MQRTEFIAGPGTDEVTFALRLAHLYPDRRVDAQGMLNDAVALIMAMEGQESCRFIVQIEGNPNPERPQLGEIRIALIVVISDVGEASSAASGRVDELSDDLMDMLGAPPLRWRFEPVAASDLPAILHPVDARSVAEIARREELCSPTAISRSIGFARSIGEPSVVRPLWSLWTFGRPAEDLERFAAVLLAQEAPVVVRTVLTPTDLADQERDSLEEVLMGVSPDLPLDTHLRAARHSLEAFLQVRPLFAVRCLVASPERLSRSMLSAIGHSISQPPRSDEDRPHLVGGFSVIRGGEEVPDVVLREAFDSLAVGQPLPSLAPSGLSRLRRVFGPWEAANLFRFPIADDHRFPGLELTRTPDLSPPLAQLARSGRRLGSLVAHDRQPVLLGDEERFRHMYVSGQTGTGKSTLLLNLATQDILAGDGVAVIDPHGDLVEALLRRIPEDRVDDVVLIDPADPEAVVGVNLLEAETPVQQNYIVSELCEMFYSLFDPMRQGIIGPRYESMLRQGAGLLLANPEQVSSFLDIATVFSDPAVRRHLVDRVRDPVLAEFWLGEMAATSDFHKSEVLGWFRSKFEVFRTSQLVRNVVGQGKSTFSFSEVLADRKILLVNLSKGLLGDYNSALLGHIVFSRLWLATLERASVAPSDRPDFHVYVDEFQNSTSASLPSVLSEARKFRLGLTLANQFFTQVPEATRDAIMGNVGSKVTLRIGPKDAQMFTEWLGRDVSPDHLTSLPNYVGIASLSNKGVPIDPLVMRTDEPSEDLGADRAELVRSRSRELWARPVAELEDDFFGRWAHVEGSIAERMAPKPPPPTPVPARERSFIDEWLDRRRSETDEPGVGGDHDDA